LEVVKLSNQLVLRVLGSRIKPQDVHSSDPRTQLIAHSAKHARAFWFQGPMTSLIMTIAIARVRFIGQACGRIILSAK
jgi:hypothetical protein